MPKSRTAKRPTRKAARKPARKAAAKSTRKATRKAARKSAAKVTRRVVAKRKPAARTPAAKRPQAVAAPWNRTGVITHTELASADPPATRTWCETVLGWKFGEPMPTPTGPYHMWRFPNETGGGIRENNPPETPGSIPYCEVNDIHGTYAKALAAGATEMLPPMALPSGMGWIAIVAAPGGVAIGFWSMS